LGSPIFPFVAQTFLGGEHLKLEKEGLLHPRKLVNSEGWTYCSVYLLKENKEFFEKYPKQPLKH